MSPPDEILCSVGPGETWLALIADGRPVELAVVRPHRSLLGGIWLGRVVEVHPALGTAFVEIGEARPGVLSGGRFGVGDAVLVQATADPGRGKGAKLTAAPSLAGSLLALSPARPGLAVSRRIADAAERVRLKQLLRDIAEAGEGLIARSAAAGAAPAALAEEAGRLRATWAGIQARAREAKPPARLHQPDPLGRMLADNPAVRRVLVDDPAALAALSDPRIERHRDGPLLARHGVDEAIEAALRPEVPLSSGGRLIIEETAALVVVDVDSGPAGPAETNAAAVAELTRQMRLRNLSGHLVVDFIPRRGGGHAQRLTEALRRAVADDPLAPNIAGISPLGLVELTRGRRAASLAAMMLEGELRRSAEAVAAVALAAVLREAASRPGRPLLVAAPDVLAAARAIPGALAETERRLGRPLELRPQPGRPREDYVVEFA